LRERWEPKAAGASIEGNADRDSMRVVLSRSTTDPRDPRKTPAILHVDLDAFFALETKSSSTNRRCAAGR